MKIFISADIEGIIGIAHWDEATRWKPDYPPYNEELMNEIKAACEGANLAGTKEILINDGHGVGRNLNYINLPENTKIIRSFSGHPYCMMQEIDNTFDAVLMIGYHSYGASDQNPLSHTLDDNLSYIKINGDYASEFLINSYTASLVNVPVVFVSGDIGLCEHVKEINKNIETVGLNKGVGNSVISIHPKMAFDKIKHGVENILKSDFSCCSFKLPRKFDVEISYLNHTKAYKKSFYPGIIKKSSTNLYFETNDYFEVLRMLSFVID